MSYAKGQDLMPEAGQAAPLARAPRVESAETAATGHGPRVMRRLDGLARFSAEPAAAPRSRLTPEHEAAAVRVTARTNEAGTNADPDTAGDAAGRHEARRVAAGTPFGSAGTTDPLGIMPV